MLNVDNAKVATAAGINFLGFTIDKHISLPDIFQIMVAVVSIIYISVKTLKLLRKEK